MPADLDFIYAWHDALLRDLGRLERAGVDPAPARVGWNRLREELEFYYDSERDVLWPNLRARTDDAAELRIIEEMGAERMQIAPALDAVAHAFDDRSDLKAAIDRLTYVVRTFLDHEERCAMPIIARRFSDKDLHDYLRAQRRKRGSEVAQHLCWVLDGADTTDRTTVLREVSLPDRLVYRYIFEPRYRARRVWSTHVKPDVSHLESAPV